MVKPDRPNVLLLSLSSPSHLDSSYESMFDILRYSTTLKRARTSVGATVYLGEDTPQDAIITD